MQWSRWEMMGLDRGHGSAVERRCLILGTARRRSCQFLVTDWLWEERRGYHQYRPGEEIGATRRQRWASSSSVSGSGQVFLLLVYVTRQNQHSNLSMRSPLKRDRMCLSGGSRYTLTLQHSPATAPTAQLHFAHLPDLCSLLLVILLMTEATPRFTVSCSSQLNSHKSCLGKLQNF